MTAIAKTSHQVAFNTQNTQKAQFDVANTVSKVQPALQPPQTTKIKPIRAPSSAQHVIIQTNGKLRSFKITPQGSRLLLSTPKNMPFATLPNNAASLNALKAGATGLGVGEVATGAGTASGYLTLGGLATFGLCLLAGGVTFLVGTGNISAEEETVLKHLKKQETQSKKPKFAPPKTPLLTPPKTDRSFTQTLKPKPFKPVEQPVKIPVRQPSRYKTVPIVPPLSILSPIPKGGSIKIPYIKGVKLTPLEPNYVGAKGDVKANKPSVKQAKGAIQAAVDDSDKETSATSERNTNKDSSHVLGQPNNLNPDVNARVRSRAYWEAYEVWLKVTQINDNKVVGDPLKPKRGRQIGFYKDANNITQYGKRSGSQIIIYDASIFDGYRGDKVRKVTHTPPVQIKNSSSVQGMTWRERSSTQSADYKNKMKTAKSDDEKISITYTHISEIYAQIRHINAETSIYLKATNAVKKASDLDIVALKNSESNPILINAGSLLTEAIADYNGAVKNRKNAHAYRAKQKTLFEKSIKEMLQVNTERAVQLQSKVEELLSENERNSVAGNIPNKTPEQRREDKNGREKKRYKANSKAINTRVREAYSNLDTDKKNKKLDKRKEKRRNSLKNETEQQAIERKQNHKKRVQEWRARNELQQ